MATQALRSTSALEIKVLFKLQNDFLEDANKITCHGIWCRRHISDKQVIPCLSPEGGPKGALALTYSSEDDGCNSFPTTQRFVYYSPQASKKIGSWKAGTNLKNRLSFTTDLKGGAPMVCYWYALLLRNMKSSWVGHASPTHKYFCWGTSSSKQFILKCSTDCLKVPEASDCLPQRANLILFCGWAELNVLILTLNKKHKQQHKDA